MPEEIQTATIMEDIMRSSRRFKTLLYWIILIGYCVAMFYMWINFKREMREGKQQYEKDYRIE
jgi:hypothetical protein